MPSHRADTPADAPTALLSRTTPAATPAASPAASPASSPAPFQRRRDLRARAAVTEPETAGAHSGVASGGGLDWLQAPPAAAVPVQREAPAPWATPAPVPATRRAPERPRGHTADTATLGALALDPLFLASPDREPAGDDAPADGPLAPVQPLRRPRGKERAQVQTTRRALREAAAAPAAPNRRGTGSRLPQAGIAGALGIATIAVPLCSALGVVPASAQTSAQDSTRGKTGAAAAALTPLPPFPLAEQPALTALADPRLLPDERPVAEVPAGLAAPRIRLITDGRASRGAARAVLPGCDGKVRAMTGIQNGRLPASMLCTLWDPEHQLRADAAVAIAKLNVAYTKRFGRSICFNDAYRSLAEQYAVKAKRGGYAARPGTSEHGWGLAVDLCDGVDEGPRSATYAWLRENAPAYGWENPTWARGGGSGPYEPWHWEYMPGERGQSKGD